METIYQEPLYDITDNDWFSLYFNHVTHFPCFLLFPSQFSFYTNNVFYWQHTMFLLWFHFFVLRVIWENMYCHCFNSILVMSSSFVLKLRHCQCKIILFTAKNIFIHLAKIKHILKWCIRSWPMPSV